MKKKILIIILVIVILISAGIVYLNDVVLPLKVKALLVRGLAEQTQKKVSLESLHFNIFRGVVFKNLVIYDDKDIIVSLKEGSCIFLMVPLFKKTLVIPVLSLRSPQIFLQRRKDNTYNLADLFLPKKGGPAKQGFSVYIYKIGIDDARLRFRDETLPQPFEKEVENLDLNLYLSLPDRVKFNLRGDIRANPLIHVLAAGAWRISTGELTARASVPNLSPKEFAAYYQQTGLFIPEGIVEVLADVQGGREAVQCDLTLGTKNLLVIRQGVSAKIASSLKAALRYGLKDKSLVYSGKAQVADSAISGLGSLGEVKNINGDIVFSDSEISSEKLTADLFEVPVEAKLKLSGLPAKPLFDFSVNSDLSLVTLKSILKDNFKFNIPAALTGDSQVFFSMHTTIPPGLASQVHGYVDITNATVTPEKMAVPVQEINGRVEFSLNHAQWRDLSLKYAGAAYKTSGTLNNFAAPQLDITVSSADISLAAKFAVNNKLITLSKLSGRRFNSDFAIEGTIDTADLPKVRTDLTGGTNLDLQDLKVYFPKFQKQLEGARPMGLVNTQFNLKGDVADFKSCQISARLSSPSISAWGLKFQDFVLNYDQQQGLIDIPVLQCSFYDGMIKAAAKMNLASDNLPYQAVMDLDGAKLEKLKADTPLKNNDISGTLRMGVKLNGFSDDLSKLSGAGNVSITDGRLWQLDLFKGMGALIFAKDFANITFKEGSCAFFVQDNYVFTDNLKLKSDIAELAGAVKIGFNSSIDATLDVSVKDDMVPVTGTFRDVTTAIIGQAGKFGTIKISGTLAEPKFKFKTAVTDIIKTLKDVFLNR